MPIKPGLDFNLLFLKRITLPLSNVGLVALHIFSSFRAENYMNQKSLHLDNQVLNCPK